jgi:predicted 3-demethylubiquinone-9 3-methyltransferase (glyoxalase superfamily)
MEPCSGRLARVRRGAVARDFAINRPDLANRASRLHLEHEMAHSVATFLMFDGVAEEALRLYVSVFARAELRCIEHWKEGEPGRAGTVKRAELSLCGHELIAFDSPVKHGFTFTPAISLFVECESEVEAEAAYAQLSAGGQVLMGLANHGFSRKFGWVNDRYGVSWQLNWA